MQIESRTCHACLGNYAEMQLCFCKVTLFVPYFQINHSLLFAFLMKSAIGIHMSWMTDRI